MAQHEVEGGLKVRERQAGLGGTTVGESNPAAFDEHGNGRGAGVQSSKFKISESNTFLVLHVGESLVPQKIISLGVFDLPASKNQPASVLLLEANPELVKRIDKEVAAGDR